MAFLSHYVHSVIWLYRRRYFDHISLHIVTSLRRLHCCTVAESGLTSGRHHVTRAWPRGHVPPLTAVTDAVVRLALIVRVHFLERSLRYNGRHWRHLAPIVIIARRWCHDYDDDQLAGSLKCLRRTASVRFASSGLFVMLTRPYWSGI